jgi:hypothetical protein
LNKTISILLLLTAVLLGCPTGKNPPHPALQKDNGSTGDQDQVYNGLIFSDDFSDPNENWVFTGEIESIQEAIQGPGMGFLPYEVTNGKINIEGRWSDQSPAREECVVIIFREEEEESYYALAYGASGLVSLSSFNPPEEISLDEPVYLGTITGGQDGGIPLEFSVGAFPSNGNLVFHQTAGDKSDIRVSVIRDNKESRLFEGKAAEYKGEDIASYPGEARISISSLHDGSVLECLITLPEYSEPPLTDEELIYEVLLEDDHLTSRFSATLVYTGALISFYCNGVHIFESFGNDIRAGDVSVYISENTHLENFSLWDFDTANPNVFGTVKQTWKDDRPAPDVPVRAYQVIDIETLHVSFVQEVRTNREGEYQFYLPPVAQYIIEAGVTEEEYERSAGAYGARFVDLLIPAAGPYCDIALKQKQGGIE